jgi:hypothetical protein
MHCVQEGRRSRPVAWMRAAIYNMAGPAGTKEGERSVVPAQHKLTSNGTQMGDRAEAGTALCERTNFSTPRRMAIQEVAAGFGHWEQHQQRGNPKKSDGKGGGTTHTSAERRNRTRRNRHGGTFEAVDERGTRIIQRSAEQKRIQAQGANHANRKPEGNEDRQEQVGGDYCRSI